MLVTCFGYLGYKNARFGKIEAHEAVTAYGRDKFLTAKEILRPRASRCFTASRTVSGYRSRGWILVGADLRVRPRADAPRGAPLQEVILSL